MITDLCSQQLSLAGIRIDALERGDLIQLVDRAKVTRAKLVILHHNLHSLYLHETDPAFRASYEQASCVYIDGLPLVWLGGFAGLPLTAANRVTLLDSFEFMLAEAARRCWRVYYLGSSAEVLARALTILRDRFPSLVISGRHGFFSKEGNENSEVIADINKYQADLLFVGMGMPLQEKWLAENQTKLSVPAIMTSGGTLDYVTGNAYRPPRWAGRLGLYGVFRMCSDPRRLWRRYLVEPTILCRFLAKGLLRQALANRVSFARGEPAEGDAFAKNPSSVAD